MVWQVVFFNLDRFKVTSLEETFSIPMYRVIGLTLCREIWLAKLLYSVFMKCSEPFASYNIIIHYSI